MKKMHPIVWAILCLPVVYFAMVTASVYIPGENVFALLERFSTMVRRLDLLRWTAYTPRFLLVFLLLYGGGVLLYYADHENRRPGEEYGSAKWGNARELNKRYADQNGKNVILTKHVSIGLDGYRHRRNLNILVVGGSGSGKTRFFCKPGIMSVNCSYLIVDPKGEMLRSTGYLLKEEGYDVKVFDLIHPRQSDGYNPFTYIRDDPDVLKLMDNLVKNTTPPKGASNDPFWEKAEIALDSALMLYLLYEAPAEEQNFEMLMFMLECARVMEEDEQYQSPLDLLFQTLEERDPSHIAVREYKVYKQAAGKTAKSILISCGARLAPFDIEELRELMSYDELELDTLGDRKTALFLIMSDTDDTFNFVIAILQSQLFNLLCDKADDEYNGKLPIHVRFLLDEFANIGQIPRFDKLIATIRSREMSASIILQSQSQLKAIYKDAAEIILDNADSTLFLGGRGKNAKDISENLGRETIDSFNTSENRGTQVSHGLNYQKLGKELMTQDEIAVMDGGKCILQLRGVRPFFSDKYDITQHPNYKYLSDFDKKNAFDVERYMSTRPAIVKPDEPFDIYEIDLSDEDAAAE